MAAGGPEVPRSLKEQLKIGGRLVIPVGADRRLQELLRITRLSETEYTTEELLDARLVPLVGEQGWAPEPPEEQSLPLRRADQAMVDNRAVACLIAAACEPFTDIDSVDLAPLLQRIGAARVVLIG